jgi:PilZ domain
VEQHGQLGTHPTFKIDAGKIDARKIDADRMDARERVAREMENRRHRRFKIEVAIRVYPRDCPLVRGDTVDLSESGISAMLRIEIPVGEVVRLEFTLPFGDVDLLAMVRQRNAFRYGFQFVETGAAQEMIGRTCSQLAMEESMRETKLP